MRYWAIFSLLIAALLACPGCAMVLGTSVSEVAKGPGHRLRAEDSGNGVLMLTVPSLDALVKLKAQCAGSLTGVATTTTVRNFFVIQNYKQETVAWCQP